MKYCTFRRAAPQSAELPGVRVGEYVLDLLALDRRARQSGRAYDDPLPGSLLGIIAAGVQVWERVHSLITAVEGEALAGNIRADLPAYPLSGVRICAPISRPPGLRDFYAFEGHVARAYANRGKTVPPEWYQMPVFYYANTSAIFGPGDAIPYPRYSHALDYELEVACVIGKPGMDIPAGEAAQHIFGYTIFNDWSARDEQKREMRVGLGPAKGKDFASSFGPWIVTPDELQAVATDRASVYKLGMSARVNGRETSSGDWSDINYSFAEMIARASQDVLLQPGEMIGSGTVGSGCLLETTRGQGPWLQPGDTVTLEIDLLGVLENSITARVPAAPGGV